MNTKIIRALLPPTLFVSIAATAWMGLELAQTLANREARVCPSR